jgi:hypothetical protein
MERRPRHAGLLAVGGAVGVDSADAQLQRGNLATFAAEQAESSLPIIGAPPITFSEPRPFRSAAASRAVNAGSL